MSRHHASPGFDEHSALHLVSHAAQDAQEAALGHTGNPHRHHRLLGDPVFLATLPKYDFVKRNSMVVLGSTRRAERLAVAG